MKQTTNLQPKHKRLFSQYLDRLHLKDLLPSITTGLIIGILIINSQISYGALIFSGDLSQHVSRGIGFTLFGAFIIGFFLALKGTMPCTIARPQDSPAAILAISATVITAQLPVSDERDTAFITVVSLIILTSLLTGLFFWLVGRFKLGNFVRFIPYPVIGGFLAGI